MTKYLDIKLEKLCSAFSNSTVVIYTFVIWSYNKPNLFYSLRCFKVLSIYILTIFELSKILSDYVKFMRTSPITSPHLE